VQHINLKQKTLTYSETYHYYRVADLSFQADVEIAELEHLKLHNQCYQPGSFGYCDAKAADYSQIYRDDAQIGEQLYRLSVFHSNTGKYRLQHHSNTYYIDKSSINSHLKDCDISLLMGPVMTLNLLLNHIFCLHASAFRIKDHTYILMAESGTGKSTIARYIDKQAQGERISDDITAVKLENNKLLLLPCFPQLKLTRIQQFTGQDIYSNITLLFAKQTDDKTSMHTIDCFKAMKNMIRHTVASLLFSASDLHQHMEFCQQSSQSCRSYTINYQHSPSSLETLYQQLYEIS
jgi:hypothetical protein